MAAPVAQNAEINAENAPQAPQQPQRATCCGRVYTFIRNHREAFKCMASTFSAVATVFLGFMATFALAGLLIPVSSMPLLFLFFAIIIIGASSSVSLAERASRAAHNYFHTF